MPLILPGNVGSATAGGFNVANSCRFDGSSAYMHKTPGSAGNTKLWTWSAWIKKSLPDGADLGIFGQYIDANNFFRIRYRSDQRLQVDNYTSGSATFSVILGSNNEHRDISAWYNLVVAYDSAQGTDSNRVKIYVNGVLQTVFQAATYPSQNVVTTLPVDGTPIELGRTTDSQFFNGYFAEVVLIDGTALAPTSFGEFDEDSGIWKPINVSGLTFGTNGFYLEFKGSGTSANASGMGADTSGNTNHFAVNNLTAIDQSTDTCTNNFATWNSLIKTTATFSEGNLKYAQPGSNPVFGSLSTIGVTSGKWYAELNYTSGSSHKLVLGVADETFQNGNTTASYDLGKSGTTSSIAYVVNTGAYRINNSNTSWGSAGGDGQIINMAIDRDNGKIYFGVNGTWGNSSNPASNSGGIPTTALDSSTNWFWGITADTSGTSDVGELNFGSPSFAISSGNTDGDGYGNFEYAVPSGYYSLNTKNLAEYG